MSDSFSLSFQEAANYLKRFPDVAPDSKPMKADAKAILTYLEDIEKVALEKGKPAPRRRQ